jgi:hypothetical protein
MRGARGFEVDVVNPGFSQLVAEILRSLALGGADPEEQLRHFFVKSRRVRERTAARRLRVKTPASAAAASAEATEVGELIQMFERLPFGVLRAARINVFSVFCSKIRMSSTSITPVERANSKSRAPVMVVAESFGPVTVPSRPTAMRRFPYGVVPRVASRSAGAWAAFCYR